MIPILAQNEEEVQNMQSGFRTTNKSALNAVDNMHVNKQPQGPTLSYLRSSGGCIPASSCTSALESDHEP